MVSETQASRDMSPEYGHAWRNNGELVASRYDPECHACWHSGRVPYTHIANTLAALDSTTKRLRIADALSNMFRAVMQQSPQDLEAVVYLTLGKIAPDYEGGELNIGGSTVSAAITDVTGALSNAAAAMAASYSLADVVLLGKRGCCHCHSAHIIRRHKIR
jgi:hypothetical protein